MKLSEDCELMKCFFEKVQEIMTEDRVDVCDLKLDDCSGFIDLDEDKREAIMDEEKDGGSVHKVDAHSFLQGCCTPRS